jgi:hypothetical protein
VIERKLVKGEGGSIMDNRLISEGIVCLLVLGGLAGFLNFGVGNTKADMWFIEIVAGSGGMWGGETSIAVNSSGYPHISYYEGSSSDLKYARWTGSAWSIQTVDSGGSVGEDSSICLNSSGYAHISYYDSSNMNLKYANWTGSTWNIVTVDTASGTGTHTSLAIDSLDYPHISYYDWNAHDLKYAKWTGSIWSIETVDSGGGWDAGEASSIALDSSGYPHISYKYEDMDDTYLRYARWTGGFWSIVNVCIVGPDTSSSYPLSTSIDLDSSNRAHISYYDNTNYDLEYARWTGSSWSFSLIDTVGDVGEYNSIALNGSDYAHISYYNATNGDLKFARWTGSDWSIETADSAGDVGEDTSIAIDSGGDVHISYKDDTNYYIKYAKWTPQDRPTSSVDLLPVFENTTMFLVNATAVDPDVGDIIAQVELYYKKDAGSWILYSADATSPFSWNFDSSTTGGEGVYQFYSRAQDNNGYWEDSSELPPSSGDNDTWTIVDTTNPLSYIDTLPSYETTAIFAVSAQTSEQNGIAQVELYYQKDAGGWQLYGTDITSPFSWNFDSSGTGGDGIYHFYSRAQDMAGLWEDPSELPPSSGNNDTWTLVDTVKPISNATALPALITTVTFTVDATASDSNGIAQVELNYRKDAGSWQLYGTDTSSPFSWNFDSSSTGGDGVYQFYSRTQDISGLWEDPSELPPSSGNNDTWTLVDTTSPISSVDALPNFESSLTFDVNASASDQNGIIQVELYYQKDAGGWQLYGTDTTSPYSWNFDASGTGGDGIYQFYSRTQDNCSLWEDPSELPPSSGNNDTWTIVDTIPPTSLVDTLQSNEITATFAVDAQTSDQNGIAQVELYYNKDGGGWQLYGLDPISPFSWNFDSSSTGGDGVYQFYSRAQDNCGLWEDPSELPPSSGNNDTWTLVDTIAPVSSVSSLPSNKTTTAFSIESTASDLNSITQVELYYKKDAGGWQLYGTDTTSPYSWNFDTSGTGGDGIYQFYSRAQDKCGLWEDFSELPPSSGNNDTWTLVDTTNPLSNVDALPCYETGLSFQVNATASDLNGIAQVELYYKKDTGPWELYGTDTTSPYSWSFDASGFGGEGVYQFYSRALDYHGLWEDPSQLPPSSGNNDSWTIVDITPPTSFVDTLPSLVSTEVIMIKTAQSDLNGIALVELYYSRDTGSWQLYGTDTTLPFSWNFNTSSTGGDGLYRFHSRARDKAGLWEDPSELPPSSGDNDTWTVIDTTKPTISNLTVEPSTQEINNYVNISADVTDNYALFGVWINITNPEGSWINVTMSTGLGSGFHHSNIYNVVGTYHLTVWANDMAHNWAFSNITFVIQDTAPPSITNLTPAHESTTNESMPIIGADYSDLSGIDVRSVILRIDDVDLTASATVMAHRITYTPETALSEGVHTVYLEVRDDSIYSNRAIQTWIFTVAIPDTTLPAISNFQPSNTSTVDDNTPVIRADYSDESGIETGGVVLKIDNMDVTASASVKAGYVKYIPALPLSEGRHNVTLEVRDNAGNVVLSSWFFTVDAIVEDTNPPTAVAGPDMEIHQGKAVRFNGSGSIDDGGFVTNYTWTFTYNEGEVILYGSKPLFRFEMTGNYQVTLTVMDPFSNSGNDTMRVNVITVDSDGDGLSDYDEVHVLGTNSSNADTDGDGILDGDEIAGGTDPLVPEPVEKEGDFISQIPQLYLLIIIIIVVIITAAVLVVRKRRKPEELEFELMEQPAEQSVSEPEKPILPPPPPSKASQPLPPPPPPKAPKEQSLPPSPPPKV